MGRKGSKLVPFLLKALIADTYCNLKYEDPITQTFSLMLPRKTLRIGERCQYIIHDWYRLQGRSYRFFKDYTDGKQIIESALRSSDFLSKVQTGRNQKLIYRMLNKEEIAANKLSKKLKKSDSFKEEPLNDCALSPESSGYGSGLDSADENASNFDENSSHLDKNSTNNLIHGLMHDHKYLLKIKSELENIPEPKESDFEEKFNNENDPPPIQNGDADSLFVEQSKNYIIGLDVTNTCSFDMFDISNVPNDLPMEDCEIDAMDFSLLDEANNDNLDLEQFLKSLNDKLPSDLEDCTVTDEESVSSDEFNNVKIGKVYECLCRQNLPGMIILTLEPKFKEFTMSDTNGMESIPGAFKVILDDATMQLLPLCPLEGLQILTNDHLLMFLKTNQLVN